MLEAILHEADQIDWVQYGDTDGAKLLRDLFSINPSERFVSLRDLWDVLTGIGADIPENYGILGLIYVSEFPYIVVGFLFRLFPYFTDINKEKVVDILNGVVGSITSSETINVHQNRMDKTLNLVASYKEELQKYRGEISDYFDISLDELVKMIDQTVNKS